ncbi:HET-domain-containing protein [Hypomontagnella monticulosa]|nr:HET-domain-containing protein [Hypomontagnella monticulosa]
MLCSTCVNFDVRDLLLTAVAQAPKGYNDPSAPDTFESLRPAIPHFFEQHPSLLSLRSCLGKCALCDCIWQSYSKNAHPNELTDAFLLRGTSARQIYIGTAAWDVTLNGLPHITVIQDGDRGAVRTLASFEVCALRGYEPSDHQDLLARSIYSNSGSEECLQLAAGFLEDCLRNHKSCSSQYSACSEFPTRIIDTQDENPRLIDGGKQHGTFAALSYCWGGDTDFKLTKATEQSFRDGIPLSQFPATLHDAIQIIKALGIRYIWIDALCIIQDSALDWAQEAARMREVYRGAVVTIAAACASKTSEGIFRERFVPTHPRCWLDWKNGDKQKSKVFLRPGSELWDERMHQSVLNTRGWVLQETLLAPRTLWFSQQQLCFECPKGSVDEAGRNIRIVDMYRSKEFIQALRQDVLPGWKRKLIAFLHDRHLPSAIVTPWFSLTDVLQAKDLETIRHRAIVWRPFTIQGDFKPPANSLGYSHSDLWREIIENYSSRRLTNPTDALPALSGLASEFHRATGDTYVAGLWKMDIIQGLSWSRWSALPIKYKNDEPILLDKYLAPSWSWASILGKKVLFMANTQYDHVKRYADVLDIKIQLATKDPFGAVQGGSITLRAPFLELPFSDLPLIPPPSSPYPALMEMICEVLRAEGDIEYKQKHRAYEGQKFAILQLLRWRRALKNTDRMCFLLLESVEGEDSWRRIERLNLTTKDNVLVNNTELMKSQAILAEVKPALRRQVIRII